MAKVKPLRLFFLRHGQTENFENPPFNGWRDAPLTSLGRLQLEQAAEALCTIPFDGIHSSDLSRSVYGAEQLSRLTGVPANSNAKWREMNFGRWEGLNYQQITANEEDKKLIHQLFSPGGGDITFPGGESSLGFAERISAALDDLLAQYHDGGRVALIAHGGVCKALWGRFLSLAPDIAWRVVRQDFAALNVADIYPDGNVVGHLVNGYAGPEGYHKSGPGFERLTGADIF